MAEPSEGVPATWVRDHLANERTLLSWVRTAIAFMAFGVAVAKLGLLLRIAAIDHPDVREALPSASRSVLVGVLLIACGGALGGIGLLRARRWGSRIHPGQPRPGQTMLTAVAVGTMVLAVLLVLYLVL